MSIPQNEDGPKLKGSARPRRLEHFDSGGIRLFSAQLFSRIGSRRCLKDRQTSRGGPAGVVISFTSDRCRSIPERTPQNGDQVVCLDPRNHDWYRGVRHDNLWVIPGA